ncbi:MAG: DUF4476 domain-containing protein [Chitinophagaceae bacterium]|nr:DUF4476 domain-containing protein [Chitinophagaceae bacterium]
MKTISTLFMAIFISLASFAIPAQSKLSITVVGHRNIQIMVDNNRYEGQENSIVLNNLQPGSHTVRVYSSRKDQRRSIWGKGNNTQLIYSSTVYVRPGYFTGITIDRYGRALVDERAIRSNRRNDDWDDYKNDGRNNDRNDRYDGRDGRYNDQNEYNRRPVSEQSFTSMVQILRREYSENSRLVLAKQMAERNYFSAEQVKYMMQLFSFENNKLELAKFAYRNTIDQKNYFVVYDALTYSSSKEQLADFIRRF